MAEVRKLVRWATGKRKCGRRVWKTKWVTVNSRTPKKASPAS